MSCGSPSPDPECSTCVRAQARHASLALVLGSCGVLFGVAGALGFPLLWPQATLGWHLLAASAAALVPIAGLGSPPRPRSLGGSPARVFAVGGAGVVERRELAERLASARGQTPRVLWLPPIVYRPRWWALPALALGLAWLAYRWHHPRLWVINLTAEPLRLSVDGARGVGLEPSGVARVAAVELRLPRGDHELAALDHEERVVSAVHARLESGKDHLYAPASSGRCFWLELVGYGRDATHAVRPLLSAERFFTLEADVDVWFAESAEAPGADRRSSGGTLTLLRGAPCARAPEAVRRAASAVGP